MNSSLHISLINPGSYHIRVGRYRYVEHEINTYIKSLAVNEVDWVERYNSGDPYLGVRFKDEEQHLMFVLKWGHLIKKDRYYDWQAHWKEK